MPPPLRQWLSSKLVGAEGDGEEEEAFGALPLDMSASAALEGVGGAIMQTMGACSWHRWTMMEWPLGKM